MSKRNHLHSEHGPEQQESLLTVFVLHTLFTRFLVRNALPSLLKGLQMFSEFFLDPIVTGNSDTYEAHIGSMKTYVLRRPRSDVSNFLEFS